MDFIIIDEDLTIESRKERLCKREELCSIFREKRRKKRNFIRIQRLVLTVFIITCFIIMKNVPETGVLIFGVFVGFIGLFSKEPVFYCAYSQQDEE